jgi:hypothetical protein
MIPYKIHHIWLQGGIPDQYQSNYDKWDAFLFGWEHQVWDESSLLELCNPDQKKKYNTLDTLINRVNYLKYILMYHEGGIYADLDSYPIKDLYNFFVQNEIKDIDLEAKLSIRYPFNCVIPDKPFGEYDVILPGRKTMFFYPNGDKPILLDNPILMSREEDTFWLDLIEWCEDRTNLKSSELSDNKFLPHEPYGPYGMTDFVFSIWDQPYEAGILILPPSYFLGSWEDSSENKYIIHEADRGW